MLPHGVAVVATVLVVGALFGGLAALISSEIGALLADEDFVASIDEAVDDAYDALNRFASLCLPVCLPLSLSLCLSVSLSPCLSVSDCVWLWLWMWMWMCVQVRRDGAAVAGVRQVDCG